MIRPGEEKSGDLIPWALLDPTRKASPGRVTGEADDEQREDEGPWLVCRSCKLRICPPDAVFSVTSGGSIQVFPNPSGWLRKIFTVRRADNLHLHGPGTLEFTWFAGYAWSVATCAGCGRHLGWAYDAARGQAPARFFGLLVDEVVPG